MLALALSSLRSRRTAMAGALAAVALAVALVVSSGILLESSLGAPIRAERLAGAPIVVQGDPALAGPSGSGETVLLTERRRLPERLAARVAAVPGVAQAIADRSSRWTFVVRTAASSVPISPHPRATAGRAAS